MPTVYINDTEVDFPDDGPQLNGIQAARMAGVEIPHYCWHPGLSVVASCRMCLVESGRRDPESGEINMIPKLVPACQTPAVDNTVFITESEKVAQARAMVEEDLLLRHPVDCPICDKAGECLLQDYHFEYGQKDRRADIKPFTSRRRSLGDTVTLFVDRCVMCSRCVRFCQEISQTNELMVTNRGADEEIDVFPGFPLENKMSGNVVDLCPVGALGDKDFLYQQRVWFLKRHEGVCSRCSTGCSIWTEENQDRVWRLKPRENPHVNQWWICDEGRYGFKHVHDEHRNVTPEREDDDKGAVALEWSDILAEIDKKLRPKTKVALCLSPFITVEEAKLAVEYIRDVNAESLIGMGHIPIVGEDERFGGGFTIHKEKCPNRRGVQKIAARAQGGLVDWEAFLSQVESEKYEAVWIIGGSPDPWIDEETAARLDGVEHLIVQDLFPSPLWERARYRLPGAAFAEREGSYVNYADRLQSFSWAVRPPRGVQTEGQVFWRLSKRTGLYQARMVLEELAREIAYFAPAAAQPTKYGVDLKSTMLATEI